VCERAAHGAAVTDERIGDLRRRVAEDAVAAAQQLRLLACLVADERSDAELALPLLEVIEAGDAVQVDDDPGVAKRSFISGMRLWPPASTFASSPRSESVAITSSSVDGAEYSNLAGYTIAPLPWGTRFLGQSQGAREHTTVVAVPDWPAAI
jgi:hypothetical protein